MLIMKEHLEVRHYSLKNGNETLQNEIIKVYSYLAQASERYSRIGKMLAFYAINSI